MSVLETLAIMFAVAFGITAYFSKRMGILKAQSGDEESSLSDGDVHRLLRFTTSWYQWFLIGYPCSLFAAHVESFWLETLLVLVFTVSLISALVGLIGVLSSSKFRETYDSTKGTDPTMAAFSRVSGIIMIVLLIICLFV